VLLTVRGVGGKDADLELRLRRWRSDKSARADAARKMARRFAAQIPLPAREEPGVGAAEGGVNVTAPDPSLTGRADDLGKALALAFPDRVSRRRDHSGETWQSVGGRAFRLDPASPLAGNQWLAVGEIAGHASGARILSAAALEEQAVLELFGDQVETRHDGDFDPATGSVIPTRSRRLGAIRLSSGPDPNPDQAAIEQALLDGVRQHGLGLLPWNDQARQVRNRAAFGRRFDPQIPSLDDDMLVQRADEWLTTLLAGKRRLGDIAPAALTATLNGLLGYEIMRRLDRLAQAEFVSPAGSRHPIDYSASAGPTVEVRAQALFGLSQHPAVALGEVPLVLAITSPAGRPIQTTRDLPGFWAGSWRDVARDMRGRYPKHPWPDDPASAAPTLRSKRSA
jgi:ATP-dependent helicase HrpB